MKRKAILAIYLTLLICGGARANNIHALNVKLVGQNTTNHTTQVQFDISWENSWRTSSGPANWDAAWVFVKYRVNGIGPWRAAVINASGNSAPSASIEVGLLKPGTAFNATTNPGMGAFIHRSTNGSGDFTVNNAQLQWNYGANGVTNNDLVDVQVYGIEEVYIPAGAFSVGSGAAADEYGSFYKSPQLDDPYPITSEAAITVGTSDDNLAYPSGYGDLAGPIPAAFPKGYAAFYCMKYELSQQGFADFLNNLDYTQSHNHYDYNSNIGRNRYAIDTVTGNSTFYSRAPYIACNFLSWADLMSYLVWAGLRPMTELEYEKACRGPLTPTPKEYAWGTASANNHYYSIDNRDAINESIGGSGLNTANGIGNVCAYPTVGSVTSPTPGPLHVGIFAASADSSTAGRVSTGSTFYGIMEMSGNVWEPAVTVSNPTGRSYTGSHGNGQLDAAGLPVGNTDWPSPSSAVGEGIRGGAWDANYPSQYLQISSRVGTDNPVTGRFNTVGGRGVRTAP